MSDASDLTAALEEARARLRRSKGDAFDPFNATLEDARAQPDAYAERGAVGRFYGAQALLQRQDYYMAHVLEAVAVCMRHDLVAPRWLAVRFLRAEWQVKWAEHRAWDDAFGAPWPKNAKLSAKRLEYAMRPRLAALFSGPLALRRTPEGRRKAAAMLGITERQVRDWTPKTRVNVAGYKPRKPEAAFPIQAHDPFGLAKKNR